ncbi:MAG: hypothetical protein PHH31_02845 [Acidaminococcaceae bacterium]|nr:hypothetical protein [Acidaminococcaceae bacterium]MDD4722081.1 hypothetical protein [Acidaminococcaceae bacterium]
MSILVNLIMVLICLAIAGAIVIIIYAWMKPTDKTSVLTSKRTVLQLTSLTDKEAVFITEMPISNTGVEDAAITDIFARPYLPQEQYKQATVYSNVETSNRRRNDNYFEAFILQKKSQVSLIVTFRFVANTGYDIKEAMKNMVDMDVAIYYNGMARKEIYIRKDFFTVKSAEISALVGGADNDR